MVIPCYNEAKHIAAVVSGAKQYADIVLVSDGLSTDNTRGIAINAGARVILPGVRFTSGRTGSNIQRGIKAAKSYDDSIIVLLDGDGQHDPEDIPGMLVPLLAHEAEIVIGCRTAGDGMPRYRRFGNKLLTAICNAGAKFQPLDALTGYWAIRASALPEITEQGWGWAIELLVKARGSSQRIIGVPVKAIYHKNYADNSAASPMRLGLALLWYIFKWRFKVEVLHEK